MSIVENLGKAGVSGLAVRKDKRGRNWWFVVYPESLPDNWLALLDEMHLPIFVSPLHDKDKNADGESKKPHYHVILMFDGNKSFDQILEISQGKLRGTIPQRIDHLRGAVRYLIHADNPEKFQYDVKDIISLGCADLDSAMQKSATVRHYDLAAMRKYIRDNEIYSFAQFYDYCDEFNSDWASMLDDSCTMCISNYIKSRIYDRRETLKQEFAAVSAENELLRSKINALEKGFQKDSF